MNEFEKKELIKSLPKEVSDLYEELFGLDNKESFSYQIFVPFCHAYSKELLNFNKYNEYERFIEGFNKVIENDEVYKATKELQKRLMFTFSTNYDDALIKDERYKVKSGKFKYESDFERELTKNFSSCFDDDIKVETQQVVGYGRCDILLNKRTAIELKKDKAKRKDVYQTFEYSFDNNVENTCLIASEFSDDVISIADKLDVSCYEYSFVYGIKGNEFITERQGNVYPIGVCLFEVSGGKRSEVDDFLTENGFFIEFSRRDRHFNFSNELKKAVELVKKVIEKSKTAPSF